MLYNNAKQKIRNIVRTIESLQDGEFPISAGRLALKKLLTVFDDLETKLDRAKRANAYTAERQYASTLNFKIYQSLPLLGFIIRSTNVRNAFELVDYLQFVADAVMQGRPQIILSCEWDYVPFAYPQNIEDLKSFVLIGMPASEAASALLLPLAGHELGHAVWRNRGLEVGVLAVGQPTCSEAYQKNIDEFRKHFPDYREDDIVNKNILPDCIAISLRIAIFHAEEIFCDMFSYALFGESYFDAFSYIVAPDFGNSGKSKHPSHEKRLKILYDIAQGEGKELRERSKLNISPAASRRSGKDGFIHRMADIVLDSICDDLWNGVKTLIADGAVVRPTPAKQKSHVREFELGMPACTPICVGDIVNAGWQRYRNIVEVKGKEQTYIERQVENLNELMLKSIEIIEYYRRVGYDT